MSKGKSKATQFRRKKCAQSWHPSTCMNQFHISDFKSKLIPRVKSSHPKGYCIKKNGKGVGQGRISQNSEALIRLSSVVWAELGLTVGRPISGAGRVVLLLCRVDRLPITCSLSTAWITPVVQSVKIRAIACRTPRRACPWLKGHAIHNGLP